MRGQSVSLHSESSTYTPRNLARDAPESALRADPVERLQARGVEGTLKVHVLYVEVNAPASFDALDREVEPSPAHRGEVTKELVETLTYLHPVYR